MSLPGDETSLFLPDNAIKNIYFGANIERSNKTKILNLIRSGPFNPGIWQAGLSHNTFSLVYELDSGDNP